MCNYYRILGIDRDADLDKIKHAYRFFCKKYHPDLCSNEEKTKFLKIQEAYETLSDKEKRQIYDKSLERKSCLIPINISDSGLWEERRVRNRNSKRFSSIFNEFFEDFFTGSSEEDFSGEKELFLEITLSREEAKAGGDFPVDVPVEEECSVCLGKGYINRFICSFCNGSGTLHKKKSVTLHVPPDTMSGSRARITLEGIGLMNIVINIEVIVS